ncbi:unnamed protein product [Aureobasidium uvarum]|uniref:Uncharacterized protein n=1 Tax=Aureobasidium uvarum TaxID=2773716 RepID=A0A9N8PRQ9_9PEZI|nr:unnamed protein product [Aureobasidium uvarum]
MSLRGSSKWGKLLRKPDGSDKNFRLNEDVVDFLKPSTEKERIPGEGTRQLAAPRIDTSAAQRWPEASDVRRATVSPPATYTSKPKRKKNVNVAFVRTPPEIIGEGGDDSEVPVVEVSRARARLARSQTERRAVAPVLDTQVAEQDRQAADYPMSAPAVRNAYQRKNSLADPTHPVNHPFFEPQSQPVPPPVPEHAPVQQSPRPGLLKRAPTTFTNLEDSPASPTSDEEVPPIPPHVELPMKTIYPLESPISPPIIDNRELATFLQDSPPHPRSLPPREAKRQSMIREEEGRVLRRLSRLDYDEVAPNVLDPRRPPSPNSPPRQSRSRSPQLPSIVPTDFNFDTPDHLRSASPQQPAPPIVLPHRVHPLPDVPGQHDDSNPVTKRNVQPSFSSSHYTNDSTHSASSHRQRLPSDFLASSSPASSVRSASLQPSNASRPPHASSVHPLPQPPSRGPSPSYFSQRSLAPQTLNVNGLTPGLTPGITPGLTPGIPGSLPIPSYDANGRSGSAFSYRNISPPEHVQGTAEHDALFDFGMRVAHMRGVFRLTAERERSIQSCTIREWIRAAIWWLHKGRAGLTVQIRNTPKGLNRPETLTQAHVDVAKTWWILTDVLSGADSPHSKVDSPQDTLLRDMDIVRASLRTFNLSMSRNNVMPPHQSLIQGQDTTMWVEYPRFASDVASLLRGNTSQTLIAQEQLEEANPLEALPLGDTRDTFCYSRMFVSASINTEEADTDRVVLPCVLTMIRGKSEFQTSVVISSQADLVNLSIRPGDGGYGKGPTWHDVSWKSKEHGLYIRLPRGFTLNLAFQEPDFRSLWSMVDYTNKIYSSMKPEGDERMIHKAHLLEIAHTDSTNPSAFSKDKVRSCTAFVFEKRLHVRTGLGETNLHRGYRLLLMANPVNKSLTMAGIPLCRTTPLLFEMSAETEPPIMHVHTQDSKRQCRTTLAFKSDHERQDFYEVLQGIATDQNEQVVARVGLRSMVAETSTGQDTIAGALQGLSWQDVRVVTDANAEIGQDQGDMTMSEHFRLIATHNSPGELLLRLPAVSTPSMTLLRAPEEDLTASLDIGKAQHGREGLKRLVQTAATTPTIRTLTFPSMADLHTFQKALTRYSVRFDGSATLFAISRRRMVVPIYKKWEATKVRIQILTLGNVTKIAAFFEDFSHADAMVFQIKAADTFEKAKGDKPAKYCIKFVDAKFSLPKKEKDVQGSEDEPPSDSKIWGKGVRRKYINLEGLEYAGEHDDITIGFETEEGESDSVTGRQRQRC